MLFWFLLEHFIFLRGGEFFYALRNFILVYIHQYLWHTLGIIRFRWKIKKGEQRKRLAPLLKPLINAKVLQAHNDLIRQLRAGDFQVVLSQSFNDELTTQLEALRDKEKDIRIILGNFNETWARYIILWKELNDYSIRTM